MTATPLAPIRKTTRYVLEVMILCKNYQVPAPKNRPFQNCLGKSHDPIGFAGDLQRSENLETPAKCNFFGLQQ